MGRPRATAGRRWGLRPGERIVPVRGTGLGQRPEVLPAAEAVGHREPPVRRERRRTRRDRVQGELAPQPAVGQAPEPNGVVVVAGEQPPAVRRQARTSLADGHPQREPAPLLAVGDVVHEHGAVVVDRHEVSRGGNAPAPIDRCVDPAHPD